MINTNEDEKQEMEAIQSAVNRSVDGIIICPTQKNTRNIEYLKSTGIPFVLIGRKFKNIDTDYVVCNDELGGYQATKELLDKGHRRILLLHGPMYISSAEERLDGYKRAYREIGAEYDEELIQEVPVTLSHSNQKRYKEILNRKNFTAIIAFSDMLAWEAWSYLLDNGVDVPDQCSIIGFDHIQSRMKLPFKLTSVSTYKGQMSTKAVELLVKRIKDDDISGFQHEIIDTKIAAGETVLPLN